jgi:hypothetical protein
MLSRMQLVVALAATALKVVTMVYFMRWFGETPKAPQAKRMKSVWPCKR